MSRPGACKALEMEGVHEADGQLIIHLPPGSGVCSFVHPECKDATNVCVVTGSPSRCGTFLDRCTHLAVCGLPYSRMDSHDMHEVGLHKRQQVEIRELKYARGPLCFKLNFKRTIAKTRRQKAASGILSAAFLPFPQSMKIN